MLRFAILGLLICVPAVAETLVASRTIRAQSILGASDVALIDQNVPGMLTSVEEAIGLEARVALYAGRPIHPGDVGPPAIIDRNQIVTVVFQRGGLSIVADGRALGRAGVGDSIRVMNLMSRATVTGLVLADGSVRVGGPDISKLK